MRIKINGVELKEKAVSVAAVPAVYDIDGKIRDLAQKYGDCVLPISIAAGFLEVLKDQVLSPTLAGAAGLSSGYVASSSTPVFAGKAGFDIASAIGPLVDIAQQFAFPVALIVATWGLIDYILGNPEGKTKIKSSLIGYIGVYVIPFIFEAIKRSFGAM
jgi:hypothetical protein